jgi:hypothetical protein
MTYQGASIPFFSRGAGASQGEHGFADPFNDIATTQMPTTIKSALWWSEYVWQIMGTYRTAMERLVSYFLSDIEIGGEDIGDDEKRKYKDYLGQQLNLMQFLSTAMRDRLCYGNFFGSVIVPFRRHLKCPCSSCKAGNMYPLRVVYENFDFQFDASFNFVATCPKTGWRGPWVVVDKPKEESEHLILKTWNPHEIEILHDPYTNETAYLWRIPEYYKRMVKEGNLYHLERSPKAVLEAIRTDKLFRFHPDAIYHMKEPTLAGIRAMGWGLPRSLINYRQIWNLQVLRRYNEAIALDYIIPFRLITPEVRSGGGGAGGFAMNDPMSSYNMGDFRSQIRNMINRRRRDPSGWNMLPFPVKYQILGGEASQLAPTEMITQAYDSLLNESGVPVDFYQGTLSVQAAPVGLRLFESQHRALVTDANNLVQWIMNTVARIMSWQKAECKLKPVTISDDMQKQMAALQLMMAQQLSGQSGLAAVGFDWETEQRRLADEARRQQEMQARMQEEMEQAGFAAEISKGINPATQGGQPGAAAPGGAAGGGQQGANPAGPDAQSAMGAGQTPVTAYVQSMSPNAAITPNDLEAAASQLAQELLGLPEGVKDSELRKLKQFNPILHSRVRAKMDEHRQQIRNQGGAMLQQQMAQGQM